MLHGPHPVNANGACAAGLTSACAAPALPLYGITTPLLQFVGKPTASRVSYHIIGAAGVDNDFDYCQHGQACYLPERHVGTEHMSTTRLPARKPKLSASSCSCTRSATLNTAPPGAHVSTSRVKPESGATKYSTATAKRCCPPGRSASQRASSCFVQWLTGACRVELTVTVTAQPLGGGGGAGLSCKAVCMPWQVCRESGVRLVGLGELVESM